MQLVFSTKFTRSCEFPVFSENPAEFRRLQAAGKTPAAVVEEVRNLLFPFLLLLLRIPGVSRKSGRVPASSGGRKSSGGGGRGGEESPIPLSPSSSANSWCFPKIRQSSGVFRRQEELRRRWSRR
ncbi:hypothetical protein KFK09_008961 [Dendrobium nobile]|uniref:Uncharacterized protein n=1 Tax=Dendrobium nobile TaxID=94219 RepID=A0A8T3BP59_DENNO|nr:hypothetical protein KFK09_008961 [Dendrobium nobile]